MQLDWRTGDIAWMKMRGFSEWPAVVTEVPKKLDEKITVKYFCSGNAPFFYAKREDLILHTAELMGRMKAKTAHARAGSMANLGKAITELEDHIKKHGEPRVVEALLLAGSKSPKKAETPKSASKKRSARSSVTKKSDTSLEDPDEPAAKVPKNKRKSQRKPVNGVGSDDEGPSEEKSSKSPKGKKRASNVSAVEEDSPLKNENSTTELVGRRVSFAEIKEKILVDDKKIGILGFGKVGRIVAKNLLTSGHDVTVWNRTREPLVYNADHYKVAFTISVLLRDCDVIFCAVREGVAVDYVVNLVIQALEKGPKEVGVVMLSAISIEKSIQFGQKFRDHGCTYLEAQAALEGDPKSMNLLCAGSQQLYQDCKSTLASFAVSTDYVGSELGRAIKLVACLSSYYYTSLMSFKEQLRFLEESEFPFDMLTFLKYMKVPQSAIARKVEQSNIQNYSETPTKLGLLVMRGNDLLEITDKLRTNNELTRFAMARSPDKEDSVYLQQDAMDAMISADRLKFQPIKNEK